MLFSRSANAVLSKSRAIYGKRIKTKDYKALTVCKNVSEVVANLKNNTYYAKILQNINENNVYRIHLENAIKQDLFYVFEKLGRYDLSVSEHFFDYILTRFEVELIIKSLTTVSAAKNFDVNSISTLSLLQKRSKINFAELENAVTYDDLLKSVKNTFYEKILVSFKPDHNEKINLVGIETALYTHLYKIAFDVIERHTKGKAKETLKKLFNLYIDLTNLVRIIRTKKFYSFSEDYILTLLLPFGNINKKTLESYVKISDPKKLLDDIKSSKIGLKWFCKDLDIVDKIPKNMRFLESRRNIRFSISPPVVFMSYIFLHEIEISNIINIIEGVRYKLPQEEIEKLLIC